LTRLARKPANVNAGGIFAAVTQTPAAQALRGRLEQGGALSCDGVPPPAWGFFTACLRAIFPGRAILVVVEGVKAQEQAQQDLETWMGVMGSPPPFFYPAWDVLPHDAKLPHADVISERLETLAALISTGPAPAPIVVASAPALLQRTLAPAMVSARTRRIESGQKIVPLDLIEWLEDQGYESEAQVTAKGEIAMRGGIVDVYPLTSPWPVRLEFFGDELESLRHFDPVTQLSREPLTSLVLPPAGELGILKNGLEKDPAFPTGSLSEYLPPDTLVLLFEPDAIMESTRHYAAQVPNGDQFHLDWSAVTDAMAARGMTIVEVEDLNPGVEISSGEELEGPSLSLPATDPATSANRPRFNPKAEVERGWDCQERGSQGLQPTKAVSRPDTVEEVEALGIPPPRDAAASPDGPRFQSLEAFRPIGDRPPEVQIAEALRRDFFAQLHRWLRQGFEVHVFCNNDGERQRFLEVWKEYGFDAGGGAQPRAEIGALARGFLCEEARLVVVTDAEVFGRYKVQRPRRLKSPHAAAARSALDIDFADFEPGDFVVHLQHGIGRYSGLQRLPLPSGRARAPGETVPRQGADDTGQECLVIEYAPHGPEAEPPKLYVPVTEAHLVSKYVGSGKAKPPLNTLGGARWAKTKAGAEEAVRDLAGELLGIQAARESQPGYAFGVDTPWQREFEGAFLYEETGDQWRAIVQTKSDMESARPMDRLICGDVGFGKTEVAIRAAFKSVMGGKQTAILVPTTILAQQHYNTFRERMADYPIRIELLSRFRTRKEQDGVLRELATGGVDIVIGTHRLVQSDVRFKDLGLVVIDEEQRFGVLQKERFKLLRKMVDVLTLSATPIPRTLYLALTGARDMSTIETPPQDRLPVETIVTHYDERLIRDAIQREMNRDGQVYFLHNRVATIGMMADKLRNLLPDARIVVGHGQMQSDELEEVMTTFVNGQADVLLSTSIIESGLDIPNANTIIIDRADRFGLSELYQLRGRVGRYKHQAHAYLLLPRHARLLTDVRKRMSAIRQYSTLGSGFKIAMRDLEIRGAGNLLGSEQSGHIAAVGFDLYCQLLKQSVSALKGEKVRPRVETQMRLDFLALSPGEETAPVSRPRSSRDGESAMRVAVPREVATFAPDSDAFYDDDTGEVARHAAYLQLSYMPESRHRIETYRRLAQANETADIEKLRVELTDRFGSPPPAVDLLLRAAEIRAIAAGLGVTVVETRRGKVMLTRHDDLITLGGKFPRLTKKQPKACLGEIRKLLLAL
jgi:transcription-repair coupling factor (superfamily II helicase)